MIRRVGLGRVCLHLHLPLLHQELNARNGSFETAKLTLPPSTERLIELLREFPSEEPTRKRFIQEMIGWSGKYGPLERGDPELHHAAGSVYAEGMCGCCLQEIHESWWKDE